MLNATKLLGCKNDSGIRKTKHLHKSQLSTKEVMHILYASLYSLSHQGPVRKPEAYGAGSHYLHLIE